MPDLLTNSPNSMQYWSLHTQFLIPVLTNGGSRHPATVRKNHRERKQMQ